MENYEILNEKVNANDLVRYLDIEIGHILKIVYIRDRYNSSWPSSIFSAIKTFLKYYKGDAKTDFDSDPSYLQKALDSGYYTFIKDTPKGRIEAANIKANWANLYTVDFLSDPKRVRDYLLNVVSKSKLPGQYERYRNEDDTVILREISQQYLTYFNK